MEIAGTVFYTELAAEYPQGLCDEWARATVDWLVNIKGKALPFPACTSA
jgi:hypothetical protein